MKKDKNKYRSCEYIAEVYSILKNHFGILEPPLDHKTPEQLAVAVILSAQCTDAQVNKITPALFAHFPDLPSLAMASQAQLEQLIYSSGFYKNKSKNLIAMAKLVSQKHEGKIPNDFSILVQLPGIGRKTANVIMNQAFGKSEGIVVDTHVLRLAKRLGMSESKNAIAMEKDLMTIWNKEYWIDFSLYLIFLGRTFCMARNPNCPACILQKICPSAL